MFRPPSTIKDRRLPTNRPTDETTEDSKWNSDLDPSQVILESDSGVDEAQFELICSELGNRSGRRILRQIANGVNTSSSIAESTGLTVQDVLLHLDRLTTAGMIKKSGKMPSFRGRKADAYEISRLAVLLTPAETANRLQLKELVRKKSADLLKRRLLMSGIIGASLFAVLYWLLATVSAPIHLGGASFGTIVVLGQSDALSVALGIAIVASTITFLTLSKLVPLTRLYIDTHRRHRLT